MICPLMSYQEQGGNRVDCYKGKCAWWVVREIETWRESYTDPGQIQEFKKVGKCAINYIAKDITLRARGFDK